MIRGCWKKIKTFDNLVNIFRCRCEKCLEKRRSCSVSDEEASSVKLRKKNICQGSASSTNMGIEITEGQNISEGTSTSRGEEIVLKVPTC